MSMVSYTLIMASWLRKMQCFYHEYHNSIWQIALGESAYLWWAKKIPFACLACLSWMCGFIRLLWGAFFFLPCRKDGTCNIFGKLLKPVDTLHSLAENSGMMALGNQVIPYRQARMQNNMVNISNSLERGHVK